MPLDAVTAFHTKVCSMLTILRKNKDAMMPPTLFRLSPRKMVRQRVLTYLRAAKNVPVTAIAHVLETIDHAETELEYLNAAPLPVRHMLAPYYLSRLRTAGIGVRRESETRVRLVFADVNDACLLSAVNAYMNREYDRIRHTGERRTQTTLALESNDAAELCTIFLSAPHVLGAEIAETPLSAVPRAFAAVFMHVRSLRLTSCALTSAQGLETLTSLEHLSLADNALTSIDDALAPLTALESLSLASNRLVTIAQSTILHWRSLRSLNMARNALRDVPDVQLAALPHLHRLDARENALERFPRALQHSASLSFVSLEHNRPPFDRNECAPLLQRSNGVLVARRLQFFL